MIDLDAIKAAGLNSRERSEQLLAEHYARTSIASCFDCLRASQISRWPVFSMGCRGCTLRALAQPPSGPGGG